MSIKQTLIIFAAFTNTLFMTPLTWAQQEVQSEILLKTDRAWNGQPYNAYPSGVPELTLVRILIPAHSSLPWHRHPMPNIAYIQSGSLTVENKESGESKTVRAGETLPELVGVVHRGVTHDEPAELLVFYAGAKGQALSETVE